MFTIDMMNWTNTSDKYLVIGAGPTGLACASSFLEHGIDFYGVEASHNVGGLWDISNPRSTMYENAHLISSRTQTQFDKFPMDNSTADYPSHKEVFKYLLNFAQKENLISRYLFSSPVTNIVKYEDKWKVTLKGDEDFVFKGVVLCSGILSEPNLPKINGHFDGEMIHSAAYKTARCFEGKRVLIVGGGNSGCDIAVDAVHHAKEVFWSLRRGYHFLPKYVMGVPIDLVSKKWMPKWAKNIISNLITKVYIGDLTRLGLQDPDHKLFQVHPILNSIILHYLGHGDIKPVSDVDFYEGKKVIFKDGEVIEVDMVIHCTGYKIHYPYIDKALLNWDGLAPKLFLNIFHPQFNNLFVLGMVEAAGLGWQGKYDQANLISKFIKSNANSDLKEFLNEKLNNKKDLSGGAKYLKIDRMAYYVHKDTYKNEISKWINYFEKKLKK
jgi:NADPH-dependent 2,4-dienoyl-CoA reductase/sulfur reductase-like enzyme